MRVHDVAIIGGGPAGATAAALLGAAGRDVVVLERESFPRFHIGESLLPWNMRIFDRLGVTGRLGEAFIEKWGATFVTSSGDLERTFHFERALDDRYPKCFEVQRAEFDRILLDNASRLGAEVRQGARVTGAARGGDGRWILDVAEAGDPSRRLEARYLLDATGRDAFMAGRGGLRRMDPDRRRAALFAHMRGVPRAVGRDAGNIVVVTLRDGWFWFIPFADGTTSVGVVAEAGRLRATGLPPAEAYAEALRRCPAARRMTREAEILTPVWSASDWTYTCGSIAGDGYLLAGDAAAFVDPVFSSGVLLAMSSAEAAADLLDETLRRGRVDRRSWMAYERTVLRHVASFRRIVDLFYTPAFSRLVFHPRTRFDLPGAVLSLLAGKVDHAWGERWRLALFRVIGAMFNHLDAGPRVDLHRVFEEEIGGSGREAAAA